MLIAADNALEASTFFRSRDYYRRQLGHRTMAKDMSDSELDDKFRKALDLLSDFAKEFPLKEPDQADPTLDDSDLNISGTVTGEVKNGNNSKSPMTILRALKNDLHSNVKLPLYFYLSMLMDSTSQWAIIWTLRENSR